MSQTEEEGLPRPSRRTVLRIGLVSPIASLVGCATVSLVGCSSRAETPLAHLYGQGWVHGAYEMYGERYGEFERSSMRGAFDAYRVLAQKGIGSLDALQSREVPFYIRASAASGRFEVQRNVPERLTFTAGMSKRDREAATTSWKRAREHIQADYEQVKTLDWALSELLSKLMQVRSANERTRQEQFRLTRQLGQMKEGTLPFELPYQVSAKDYEMVAALLIAQLEDERGRLDALEATVVSVGLAVRATDAGSASLASNVRKVLLGVVRDAESAESGPVTFPAQDERVGQEKRGLVLAAEIRKSPEYAAWLKQEREAELDQIGSLLAVLDQVTGLNTSGVFKKAMTIFSGDGDYLDYLQLAAALAPKNTELGTVVNSAVDLTKSVRAVTDDVEDLARAVDEGGAPALLNTATPRARRQLDKQLAFFESADEASEVEQALAASSVMQGPLPALP